MFTLPPYPPGQEPSTRPPPSELDPKLNGMTYTEAMYQFIEKPKVDNMTVQKPRPPLKVKFKTDKELCYHEDPRTGEKVLIGEKFNEKSGEFQLQEILKPYYADRDYASDSSTNNSKKIRSKTPAQLIDKFDPLPGEEIQRKIDFYFKPYSVGKVQKKYMTFTINEREELLKSLKKKLVN